MCEVNALASYGVEKNYFEASQICLSSDIFWNINKFIYIICCAFCHKFKLNQLMHMNY
jgi:hypothetical protein